MLVICALLFGAIIAVATSDSSSPVTNAVGTVFSPVQKLAGYVSDNVSWIGESFRSSGTYKSEIERLRLIVAKQEVEIARLKKGYWVEGVGANKEYVTGNGKSTKSLKNSKQTIL